MHLYKRVSWTKRRARALAGGKPTSERIRELRRKLFRSKLIRKLCRELRRFFGCQAVDRGYDKDYDGWNNRKRQAYSGTSTSSVAVARSPVVCARDGGRREPKPASCLRAPPWRGYSDGFPSDSGFGGGCVSEEERCHAAHARGSGARAAHLRFTALPPLPRGDGHHRERAPDATAQERVKKMLVFGTPLKAVAPAAGFPDPFYLSCACTPGDIARPLRA